MDKFTKVYLSIITEEKISDDSEKVSEYLNLDKRYQGWLIRTKI
jgi:hypothetical protein